MYKMDEKEQAVYDALPKPAPEAAFQFLRVQRIVEPHPYTIGPRHVVHAADHFGGMLTQEAIEDGERKGIRCMAGDRLLRGTGSHCQLSYAEHVAQLLVIIEVPAAITDLNAVPGLHAYLSSVKDQAVELGVDGFAFPPRGASK